MRVVCCVLCVVCCMLWRRRLRFSSRPFRRAGADGCRSPQPPCCTVNSATLPPLVLPNRTFGMTLHRSAGKRRSVAAHRIDELLQLHGKPTSFYDTVVPANRASHRIGYCSLLFAAAFECLTAAAWFGAAECALGRFPSFRPSAHLHGFIAARSLPVDTTGTEPAQHAQETWFFFGRTQATASVRATMRSCSCF